LAGRDRYRYTNKQEDCMQRNVSTFEFGRFVMGLGVAVSVLAIPANISAQGCMPLHFTTPSLGGEEIVFLRPHQWQVGLATRRVTTDKFFVGDTEKPSAGPFGQTVNLWLNSADVSLTYGLTEQTSLSVSVPLFYGTAEQTNADTKRHQVSNKGVGDISVTANRWLWAPSRNPTGNMSLGLGLKAPTGGYHAMGDFYSATGTVTQSMVTPTLQLGDGGWAILAQTQAYRQVFARTAAYASGAYSASLREHTDEVWGGWPTRFLSVPDVYTVRTGLAFALAPDQGISASLGARADGTRMSDLFGGRDDYKRSPGYYIYVEPGMAWSTGPNQFTLSVPVRLRSNYYTVRLSDGTDKLGAGGVNDFIVYAGVSRRF
jgi:hypothetical protein